MQLSGKAILGSCQTFDLYRHARPSSSAVESALSLLPTVKRGGCAAVGTQGIVVVSK